MGSLEMFVKHFRLEAPGIWVCIEPATFELRRGRFEVPAGTRFTLGTKPVEADVVALLEAGQKHQRRR
jgi:hypothetical protein